MTSSNTNKYAGLPDIDLDQQDVYESADIPDDVSTVPTSLSDENDTDIERGTFSIEAARQRFANERVEADSADFSDTLIARQKRQAYRTTREEVSSHPETLQEKVARVRREMEEVRMQMVNEDKPDTEILEWEKLISSMSSEDSAASMLTSRIQKLATAQPDSTQKPTYSLSFSSLDTTNVSHLSSRLSTLESLLGLPLTQPTTPILPTLTHLTSKLNLLTSQTSLDNLTTRLKSLTQNLATLEEKREQARQRALLDTEDSPALPVDDADQARKVDALYAALEGIERVTPVVPGILERLRGMARVHADAAGVTGGLKDVLERLGQMEREVDGWRGALEKVEMGLKESGGRIGGVVEKVEEVMTGLEGRMRSLEG